MTRVLNSFKIRSGKKILDYRLGEKINLNQVKDYFQKAYEVKKLWSGSRHIFGILLKNNSTYFLKLARSEGISIVTKNEFLWNENFNKYFNNSGFIIPKNYGKGLFKEKYFYLITDYFEGNLLCPLSCTGTSSNYLSAYTPTLIKLSEVIQKLPSLNFTKVLEDQNDAKVTFINKVENWFGDIPLDIKERFKLEALLIYVKENVEQLTTKPRHGDFTPWHLIELKDLKLGLIDGEHATANALESYDICYLIQRVYSVNKNPSIAKVIYLQLLKRGYSKDKLKTILAARAIGGFLDESLNNKPKYISADSFKKWVLEI